MTTETAPQEFTFQAEISQLLHLLSHSLYQNKEIAIRELVSNASDALDKFRHISLTQKEYEDDAELGISLEPDEESRVLTIRDNGIGMTQDELIQNLGTIAHSGSLEYGEFAQAFTQGGSGLCGVSGCCRTAGAAVIGCNARGEVGPWAVAGRGGGADFLERTANPSFRSSMPMSTLPAVTQECGPE